jgi:hypothetical protein
LRGVEPAGEFISGDGLAYRLRNNPGLRAKKRNAGIGLCQEV